jgi:hypothetical protein
VGTSTPYGTEAGERVGGPIVATKLHVPQLLPGRVSRPSLVAELRAGSRARLILVSAPAGAGKTTVLASWHADPAEQRPFAWLSLDHRDNDPVRFWSHVLAALRTVAPGVGAWVDDALRSAAGDLTELALPLLVNALASLPEPIVLVLDDYHVISNADVHQSVEFLIDHLPRTVQVAMAGRSDPPLGLARLRAGAELLEIRIAALLPMIARRNRLPLMRKGIIGGLGVASGMAIFAAVSPPTGGVSVPGLAAWAPALAGIAALTMLSAGVGLRSRGASRVIWLAAATAVGYALVNAVTKSSVGLLMHRGAGVLATWEPYTLIAAGILSGLFGQSAFNAGPLSLSLPVIDTVEPVSSVILGAAVFGERLARSPGLLALQLAGGAIAVAGITMLSRSPVTLAEERPG